MLLILLNPPEATLQATTTEPPLKKFRLLAQNTAARAAISSIAPLASVDNELFTVGYISSADNAKTNSLDFGTKNQLPFHCWRH